MSTTITALEFSKEQIRGPDHLSRLFEQMMNQINATIAKALSESNQDKSKRVVSLEVIFVNEYNPMRNPDRDVCEWRVKIENAAIP